MRTWTLDNRWKLPSPYIYQCRSQRSHIYATPLQNLESELLCIPNCVGISSIEQANSGISSNFALRYLLSTDIAPDTSRFINPHKRKNRRRQQQHQVFLGTFHALTASFCLSHRTTPHIIYQHRINHRLSSSSTLHHTNQPS